MADSIYVRRTFLTQSSYSSAEEYESYLSPQSSPPRVLEYSILDEPIAARQAAQYISDLMSDDGESEEEKNEMISSSEDDALAELLAELKMLSEWSSENRIHRRKTPFLPSVLCSLSLRDWMQAHPDSIAIDYALLLWSVGQLNTTVNNFGHKDVSEDEEERRGDLVCAFKGHLTILFSRVQDVNHKMRLRSKASPLPALRQTPAVSSSSASLSLSLISSRVSSMVSMLRPRTGIESVAEYARQRKWRLVNRINRSSKGLLSKTLPSLVRRGSEVSEERGLGVLAAVEAALFVGEALGVLIVHFAITLNDDTRDTAIIL